MARRSRSRGSRAVLGAGSSEPNLIDGNGRSSIVIDAVGLVYLTNGGVVIEVDPATGEPGLLRGVAVAPVTYAPEADVTLAALAAAAVLAARRRVRRQR